LLRQESILDLFYSYLRTRSTQEESREYFETSLLPEITRVLTESIQYTCLDESEQEKLSSTLNQLFVEEFCDYLYNEVGLYERGKGMNNEEFADFIAQQTLLFSYLKREE